MKSFGVVVFVNEQKGKSETGQLPDSVKNAFRAIKENTIPSVYITSADLTQDFGSFSYSKMKPQDFSKLFRDPKKKIREAKKAGFLSSTGIKVKAVEAQANPDVITIKNPQLETWETAKGTKVNAMLVSVIKDETYVFKTDKGKKIEAKLVHLSSESQLKLKKLLKENK